MKTKLNLGLVLLILFSSCGIGIKEDLDFKIKLETSIKLKMETEADSIISIYNITTFEWEEMYIFTPYTGIDSINSRLGFTWYGAKKTHIYQDDGINLLVFVKDERVVSYSRFPRDLGDFIKVESSGPFTKDQSIFVIREEPYGGQNWIFLSLDVD